MPNTPSTSSTISNESVQHSAHQTAVLQALFVTFLWSTSWVLIKIGLGEIPSLTFAGLRYTLAFLCLLPFAFHRSIRENLLSLSWEDWLQLIFLGLVCYSATQGTQFVALDHLPAITVSLILNFTSVLVALFGVIFLGERPTLLQWAGIGFFLAGALIYFYPVDFPAGQLFGLGIAATSLIANAATSIIGRQVNQGRRFHPLVVTLVSMGTGGVLLLISGLSIQGLPSISLSGWAIIAWLAVVNTAGAFTLWNHTLRTLPAVTSSIINSTMMIQIALLAWIFLGESLDLKTVSGILLAAAGVFIVQRR